MLFFLSSASFSFWSILSWDEDCSSIWLFLNSVHHSSYQSMIYDWREGFDKRTNSSLPPPGMFSTMVTTLPGTNCTCVGGAAGEVGGDTLLLGFFTAGESTISKALPARRWWNEYQGPWQGLYTKQVQSHWKGELPPRVSNSCLVAASTSAISSSLAWTRQNENCMSWSISSVPYQRSPAWFVKCLEKSDETTWGRGSSSGAGRRSPASSGGAVPDVVSGLVDEGLAESPT